MSLKFSCISDEINPIKANFIHLRYKYKDLLKEHTHIFFNCLTVHICSDLPVLQKHMKMDHQNRCKKCLKKPMKMIIKRKSYEKSPSEWWHRGYPPTPSQWLKNKTMWSWLRSFCECLKKHKYLVLGNIFFSHNHV